MRGWGMSVKILDNTTESIYSFQIHFFKKLLYIDSVFPDSYVRS